MKILFIGDIVGRSGREAVLAELENLKYKEDIDFCIANGENASGGLGMSRKAYEELKSAGVDYFTMGNHTFSKPDAGHLLSEGENICRPANYSDPCPGEGYAIVTDSEGRKIAVMNLMGTVYNDIALTNPFLEADKLIEKIKKVTNIIILDFHAEATSEKIAMGQYLDSRVSAVVGTHTHVQTADAAILPGGTSYITDVGMTGPEGSVLGMKSEIAIKRFLTGEKVRYEQSRNKAVIHAVIIEIDDETGRSLSIKAI
mgnify:CR=1 FL=1